MIVGKTVQAYARSVNWSAALSLNVFRCRQARPAQSIAAARWSRASRCRSQVPQPQDGRPFAALAQARAQPDCAFLLIRKGVLG